MGFTFTYMYLANLAENKSYSVNMPKVDDGTDTNPDMFGPRGSNISK